MKATIFILLLSLPFLGKTQSIYSWTAGVNPAWTSVGDGNKDLTWRPACGTVTTNCNGNYNNNELSTYTSPVMNTTCGNASTIAITFTASGNVEYGYDFLFVEYSLNGGATWINPYGAGTGWTGNFGAGYTIPPIIVSSSTNFRFRFTFDSDNIVVSTGYQITAFNINCNAVLPVELISFTGKDVKSHNILYWSTESEHNNDYFTIERSIDGETWTFVGNKSGDGNSTEQQYYTLEDWNRNRDKINYYRLSQTDFNGATEIFDVISIDNRLDKKQIVGTYNLLGQATSPDETGFLIVVYSDGTTEKIFK